MSMTENRIQPGSNGKSPALIEKIHGADVLVLEKNRVSLYPKPDELRLDVLSAIAVKSAVAKHVHASYDYVPWVHTAEGLTAVQARILLVDGSPVQYDDPDSLAPDARVQMHNLSLLDEEVDVHKRIAKWAEGVDGGIQPLVGSESDLYGVAKRLIDSDEGRPSAVGLVMIHALSGDPFECHETAGSLQQPNPGSFF